MKNSARTKEYRAALFVRNRIQRSKDIGTFLGGTAFFGGLIATAHDANPSQIFNPLGLSIVLGSVALPAVESYFAKKSCAKVVATATGQRTAEFVLNRVTDEEYIPAKYASFLLIGFGSNLGLTAIQAASETNQTLAAGLMASATLVGLGIAGYNERERHLNACEDQFTAQLPQDGQLAESVIV